MWFFRKRAVQPPSPSPEPEPTPIISVGMAPQPLVIERGSGDPSYDEAWHRLLSIAGHASRWLDLHGKSDERWEAEHWPEARQHIGKLEMLINQMPESRQDGEHTKLAALRERLKKFGWTSERRA